MTSSPRFPWSNGFTERNVQIIKSLLKKAKEAGNDEYVALLEFRNTPISGLSESPVQLLMDKHLPSSLPMLPWTLEPPNAAQVKDKLVERQAGQKHFYDKSSKPLPPLKPNDHVRYRDGLIWKPAIVMSTHKKHISILFKLWMVQFYDGTDIV